MRTFNHVLSLLLGLALAAFGLGHSVGTYPGAGVLSALTAALPALGAALSFAGGLVGSLVGLVLALVAVRRLGRDRTMPGTRRPDDRRPPAAAADPSPFGGGDPHDGPAHSYPPRPPRRSAFSGNGSAYGHSDREADEYEWAGGGGYR